MGNTLVTLDSMVMAEITVMVAVEDEALLRGRTMVVTAMTKEGLIPTRIPQRAMNLIREDL